MQIDLKQKELQKKRFHINHKIQQMMFGLKPTIRKKRFLEPTANIIKTQ